MGTTTSVNGYYLTQFSPLAYAAGYPLCDPSTTSLRWWLESACCLYYQLTLVARRFTLFAYQLTQVGRANANQLLAGIA